MKQNATSFRNLALAVIALFLAAAVHGQPDETIRFVPQALKPRLIDPNQIVDRYRNKIQRLPRFFGPPNPKFEQDDPGYSEGPAVEDAGDAGIAAPSIITSFIGPSMGTIGTVYYPPDIDVAVGPSHTIVVVNSDIYVYNRTNGDEVRHWDADDFFDTNDFTFDPRVYYDPLWSRWVIVFDRMDSSAQTSTISIAASTGSDPTGSWLGYNLPMTNYWADYPQLGYDDNAIYITANMFQWDDSFNHSRMFVLNKHQVYNGLFSTRYEAVPPTSNSVPARQWSSSNYLHVVGRSGSSSLAISRYHFPNGSTWNERWLNGLQRHDSRSLQTPAFTDPPDAFQPGGLAIDTGDTRMHTAWLRNGRLYTAHTIGYDWGSGLRAAVRPYVINVQDSSYVLERVATYGASNSDYYYPALAPNAYNDFSMVFTKSSSSVYAEARVTAWRDGPGSTLESSALVQEGSASYARIDSSDRNRWGDYLGASPDPNVNQDIWVAGEYVRSSNRWGSWVAQTRIGRLATQLVLNPASGKVGDTVQLRATCQYALPPFWQLVALPGATIHFTVYGVSVGSAVTNSSGTATLNYTIPEGTEATPTAMGAEFRQTVDYYGSTAASTLTIQKAGVALQLPSGLQGRAGELIALSATITNATSGNPIPGRTIGFTFDGRSVGSAVSNASGLASLTFTLPTGYRSNSYAWRADFAGDASYTSKSASASLTILNSAPTAVLAGTALSLDGVDDYATAPSAVYFSGDFTIEAWVRVRSHNRMARVIDFGNGMQSDNVFLALSEVDSGRPYMFVFNGSSGLGIASSVALPLNQWVHLAGTLSGNTARLFVNGGLVASGYVPVPRAVVRTSNFVGRSNWHPLGDLNAHADIDELRIWGRALTQREIALRRHAIADAQDSSLVAYWPANRGHGTSAADASGHSLNLSLQNGTAWIVSTAPIGEIHCVYGAVRTFALAGYDANDDPLTYSILAHPAQAPIGGAQPSFSFAPVRSGSDSFAFRVQDNGGLWSVASPTLWTYVPGDVNLDGCVDDVDLAAVLQAFGLANCGSCLEDVVPDGIIDDADLALVLSQFGAGC
ncbi:MAG: Ig-like domain repeat protein [Armatimonadetes bacterium]|nr:Ig-like domain repeat protein [Armatimonadota bacterium]